MYNQVSKKQEEIGYLLTANDHIHQNFSPAHKQEFRKNPKEIK